MMGKGIALPRAEAFDLQDPLIKDVKQYVDKERISNMIEGYLTVAKFCKFISNKMNETLQTSPNFSNVIVDVMRGYAETQIDQNKLRDLEKQLEEKKLFYGIGEVKQLLDKEKIKLAILENDERFLAGKNKMLVAQIKQQVRGLSRDKLEEAVSQNIQKYEELLENTNENLAELKSMGAERATTWLKNQKNEWCDEFIEREKLLTYENFRPKTNIIGIAALLRSLNYLDSQGQPHGF